MKYLLFFALAGLIACEPVQNDMGDQMGFAPVYASVQASTTVSVTPARATTNAGKIYAYNNYLFQVEQGEGIHIINNADPQNAQKIAFIKIPLCTEIAIKSNFLYTNNVDDLVVFDISNIATPQLVNRVEDAFPIMNQSYPPQNGVFFECPDPAKGVVIGWQQKMINNPKCRR